MTLYSEDFSGGTNSATITTGDSNFSFLSGTRVYSNSVLFAPSGLGLAGVFSPSGYGRFDQSFGTQSAYSIYFQRTAAQDGTREILLLTPSGSSSAIAGISINTSNQIVGMQSTTPIGGGAIDTSADTWYRMDTVFTIADTVGRIQARLCDLSSGDTNIPVGSFDLTGLGLGTTEVGRAYVGFPVDAGADGTLIVQHIRAESTATDFHSGLWVPDRTYGYYDDGSDWQEGYLTYDNGSEWVDIVPGS